MFTKIHSFHLLGQEGRHSFWHGLDEAGHDYTVIGSALGPDITRVVLQRGAELDNRRYQLASGADGTLPYHSWMVDKGDEAWPVVEQKLTDIEEFFQFEASPTALRLFRPLQPQHHLFGFGERSGSMDKRGQAFPTWNIDPPMHHNDQTVTMYVSLPYYLALNRTNGHAHGLLVDHTGEVEVDLGHEHPDFLRLMVEDDILVAYFFAGPTPADVVRQYTDLTGHMHLPPRWALGHHQSRYGYDTAREVREIAQTMRERNHPCDTLWLDIDYMDQYRNFTWNAETFPHHEQLIQDLRQQGIRTVTIIDPGTAIDEAYPVYKEGNDNDYFVRYPNGKHFLGEVWPGICVFPDFSQQAVREWWGGLYKDHLDLGVAGIWNDMNEPAMTKLLSEHSAEHMHGKTMDKNVVHRAGGENHTGPDGAPTSHRLFHNAYGMQMVRATYEGLRRLQPDQRPFVLTRSGTGGVQRYAAVWTGDNTSSWEHISLALRMTLNMNISGIPFVGMDIGGFWDDSNGELLVRFAQLGAFMPFCRNHYAKFVAHQEPWSFGEPYESAYRTAIELRYRSLPYLYTLFAEAARTGAPILRPLYYHFAQDAKAITVEDELLIGETLLSAPLYMEGATSREVYLPAGTWFDFWSAQTYEGNQTHVVAAPLESWPLFVRGNSIFPMGPLMQHTDEKATDPLTIRCYMTSHGTASYTLYDDDGASHDHEQGIFAETLITCNAQEERATVTIEEHFERYHPQRTWYEIIVYLNGQVFTSRVPAGQGQVTIELSNIHQR
ncbi:glycoside hydrolase family 31 protein [Tengunoibacter tsumagoiensis]|uniref:Alpha-glucosidase n=1 Tax=Tengunoibacter tsumagoiensis TaxID=2014871 RepID=A0A402A191_9CHLR|nr:TIM-barrel domain-containing protein [Tengunoibacter tsumagoiensis]GCE12819.1 alpha-glucosidase [Tengunoibacter tsumagoiensis]